MRAIGRTKNPNLARFDSADSALVIGIAVGGGVFVLLLIVGVVCYCRYRSKVAARKRAPQKV